MMGGSQLLSWQVPEEWQITRDMDSTFLYPPWKELITIVKRRQKEFLPYSLTDWVKPGQGRGAASQG